MAILLAAVVTLVVLAALAAGGISALCWALKRRQRVRAQQAAVWRMIEQQE